MSKNPDESDVTVEGNYSSVAELNQRLPEGVYLDDDSWQLVVHGEEYDVKNIVDEVKTRAKERGPATHALTVGGVTLGIFVAGPVGGATAATICSIIGALYDKGVIGFTEEGLETNIGGEPEYIEPEEEAELNDPLKIHDDKWYEPDSETYRIAVELPNGDRRYYKTEEGAANRLLNEYGA